MCYSQTVATHLLEGHTADPLPLRSLPCVFIVWLNLFFAISITGGDNVSVPFSLASLPATLSEDVELVLTVRGRAGIRASHTRRFVRAPPPPSGSAVRAWQVDHTSKGVLVDGTPLVMVGWFGSGGLHESAGLPAKLVDPALSLAVLLPPTGTPIPKLIEWNIALFYKKMGVWPPSLTDLSSWVKAW